MKSEDSGCHALSVKGASISQEDAESALLSMRPADPTAHVVCRRILILYEEGSNVDHERVLSSWEQE